ncbi:MAG: DUF502 domain-containing protein [Chlamydiota bacterium]
MKKIFLAGLATLLPIAITIFIILFILDLITAPFVGLTKSFILSHGFAVSSTHHWILVIVSRLLALILLVACIFILGLLGRRFILAPIVKALRALLNKIPMIKTIYRIMNDITKNALKEGKNNLFKGTAVVPFPDTQTRAMGLISGLPPAAVTKREESDDRLKGKELQSVFIPTSPHPISGFLVMYAKQDIQSVDVSTEDLFKFLLSCGIFEPGQQEEKQ